MHIEVLKVDGSFTVIVDGKFADHLCPDEALGVVAAAIFSGFTRIPYVKSYEEWDRWERKYRCKVEPLPPIAGLLTWNGRPAPH